MQLARVSIAALLGAASVTAFSPRPESGAIGGRVTYTGTPAKAKPIDLSKQPECVKLYPNGLSSEEVVTGPGNSLENVVVYIAGGASDYVPVPVNAANFDQQNCHYTTHVLALRAGQDVRISNSDPFSHNIHPLAKINREWNKLQLPGTPPFTYSYESEEFITVKCNIHAWMRAYFVVLKTSHVWVTGGDGSFRLSDLPPGKYTVTAWHELYGTQSQEVTVGAGYTQTVNFSFRATP